MRTRSDVTSHLPRASEYHGGPVKHTSRLPERPVALPQSWSALSLYYYLPDMTNRFLLNKNDHMVFNWIPIHENMGRNGQTCMLSQYKHIEEWEEDS